MTTTTTTTPTATASIAMNLPYNPTHLCHCQQLEVLHLSIRPAPSCTGYHDHDHHQRPQQEVMKVYEQSSYVCFIRINLSKGIYLSSTRSIK